MPSIVNVKLTLGDESFNFEIHERELCFGNAGTGKYCWMDGRQLRRGRGGPNFRPCVNLWWHVMGLAGETRNPNNERTLVLAECYPLVNTARSLQDVYLDAHLHRIADREYDINEEDAVRRRRSERTYMLPDEECDRLREIARSHDSQRVRRELEELFLGDLPPREEMPSFRDAARHWIGNGITALRSGGRERLREYTKTVDEWIRKYRRRGGDNRVRTFVNMFAYESKVAFYHCYCNAWSGILGQLTEDGDLDVLGQRFMQIWHHQNCAPVEAEVHRDAFCGQVLALHPLSAVVLTSPQHLEVIGRWIGHQDYDSLYNSGEIVNASEYWDLVATILISAHEYNRSRENWEETRGQTTVTDTNQVNQQARDDALSSARLEFEDYAAARQIVCPQCSGSLSYSSHEIPEPDECAVKVDYSCKCCSAPHSISIDSHEAGE